MRPPHRVGFGIEHDGADLRGDGAHDLLDCRQYLRIDRRLVHSFGLDQHRIDPNAAAHHPDAGQATNGLLGLVHGAQHLYRYRRSGVEAAGQTRGRGQIGERQIKGMGDAPNFALADPGFDERMHHVRLRRRLETGPIIAQVVAIGPAQDGALYPAQRLP